MSAIAKAFLLIRTAPRLGFRNVAEVIAYRLLVSQGWYARDEVPNVSGPLLHERAPCGGASPGVLEEAAELLAGRLRNFSGPAIELGSPPDWLFNPYTHAHLNATEPWWRTKDGGGDIKGVWEASRFDWVLVLARAARASGDASFITLANEWLSDWIARNPACRGPNWKCGQETSIRLMQTLLAARILNQDRNPQPALAEFARIHLARIAQTRAYADAQDNNHATSEAFALFAGGAWLASVGGGSEVEHWSALGRRWLEKATARLVFDDGGFSQYSLNYHRVMLETLSQAEAWRRRLGAPEFSDRFLSRARAATRWLAALTNATSGNAPNLGTNDGAHVYRLDSGAYRDYRPCVQLAANLFCESAAFEPGPWDEPLEVLGMPQKPFDPKLAAKTSRYFPDFGLALLNPRTDGTGAYAFVRVPRDRFRPSHADPLHFDLWTGDGVNLLRDGGSYSYSDADAMNYFTGIEAHNTIAFDGREPMPRISRFLFGEWIRGDASTPEQRNGEVKWTGHYRDRHGVTHRRAVTARDAIWLVEDDIAGYSQSATLRWRLQPDALVRGQNADTDRMILTVESGGKSSVEQMPESLLYGQRAEMPGLVVIFAPPTRRITTRIQLK